MADKAGVSDPTVSLRQYTREALNAKTPSAATTGSASAATCVEALRGLHLLDEPEESDLR